MKEKTARRFLAKNRWKLAEGYDSKLMRRACEARRVLLEALCVRVPKAVKKKEK